MQSFSEQYLQELFLEKLVQSKKYDELLPISGVWAPLELINSSTFLHNDSMIPKMQSINSFNHNTNDSSSSSLLMPTRKRPHFDVRFTKTLDEKVALPVCRLVVVQQPEQQHRARYLSEGSRGAIKDRSGTSNCVIQLFGYYRATRVELFVVQSFKNGPVMTPHPLYRLIPVSGKSASVTPCQKIIAQDGIDCLEITLRPENNMIAVLDCVGILKICTYDAKNQSKKNSAEITTGNLSSFCNSNTLQQNSVRIAMRAYVPNGSFGNYQIIHTETEPIRCVQQLGVPEVLKMSLGSASSCGGAELFMIGRNFDRNTKVLFREYNDDGTLGWNAEAFIDKQYLHQCHIVCTVPEYYNKRHGGTVSVTVVCASKSSYPKNFIFLPYDEFDDWRPPGSPKINLVDFTLPDYKVDNQNNFVNLQRNYCSSFFYNGEDVNSNVSTCQNNSYDCTFDNRVNEFDHSSYINNFDQSAV